MDRLAVLGSPITHSRSPLLHAAAYRALGLDWEYSAVEITEEGLAGFVTSRDPSWRGLSLTMPLKVAIRLLLADEDRIARVTGAVNTVLFDRTGVQPRLHGFNTDVTGIVHALGDAGIHSASDVEILGGGATAASALAAAAQLGSERVIVTVRSPERAATLLPVAEAFGVALQIRPFSSWNEGPRPELVMSTLPGNAAQGLSVPEALAAGSVLFDVAYAPWPSLLAAQWAAAGSLVISGLAMLVHQALAQVRIFVTGDPTVPLPRESAVLRAMQESTGEEAVSES